MDDLIKAITIGKTKFLISSHGLVINTIIKDIITSPDYLEIIFDNGFLVFEDTITIRKVRKPANVLGTFKFCYSLSNSDKHLGYICESIK